MDSSGGDNSPSLSESAGSSSWRKSWDNSSTQSALNIGGGSEIDGGDEDKEIASKAVAFVIRSSRKGVVTLCADVANLLKIKWRLERTIKTQQLEIHRLLSSSRAHWNLTTASTQTDSTGPGGPDLFSGDQPGTQPSPRLTLQAMEAALHKEEQQFVFRESPSALHQPGQETSTAPRNAELPRELIRSHKSTVSREVQVECPKVLMQKRCEEQLMETLLLNSRLTEDLGNAWRQIELLRDRLRQNEKQPEEILSVEHTPNERGTVQRQESMWCDTEPFPAACHCQAPCQGTGQESYRESQCSRQKPSETEPGRGKKPSMNCTVPATESRLQPRSRHESPRTRSPDFLVDATLSSSVFPFPMVGCQCSSCVSFFNNYKLTTHRNGHDKEIKPLLHFQRQKLPINVNDYVIVNGNKSGTARYVGHLDSSGMANAVFVGVELDEPSGKHDGVFEGKRYFQCYENFAIFVPVHEIFYVINRKPKKSISPPAPRSVQHRCSLGSLTSLTNDAGGHAEHSHPARKKQPSPKDLNPTRRTLRRPAASAPSGAPDAATSPSQEEWNNGNERTEKAPVSPSQPKTNSRGLTITASLPPDFSHYRPVYAPNRTSPRKVVRR
ncbi:uncharacterized protein LOC134344531 [Mobula hypostoma]|uniref:uncharacterized protein LOC134344531 n=1 Tax=Mobula hypostoma TaxID=723540 RepID=UPI002FC33C2E